ncbi:PaaI family thioesterase [Clostridioides difficile]
MNENEKLYNKINDSFKKQNFLSFIGAELEHVENGKVIITCKHKDSLTQQQGLLHGGVVTSLADVSCGYADLTTMPEDSEVLTVEFKINLTYNGEIHLPRHRRWRM